MCVCVGEVCGLWMCVWVFVRVRLSSQSPGGQDEVRVRSGDGRGWQSENKRRRCAENTQGCRVSGQVHHEVQGPL